MKIYLGALLIFLFNSQHLFAQNENAKLLVQSPDGRTVKLVWFLKSWNSGITGFDIKRKEGLQDWVKLNSGPILPCISTKKDLSIVDANKNEENAVKAKLYKLLAAHKLRETGCAAFLEKLNNGDTALKDISNLEAHDYDIALISGFAYVDHSATRKTDYQYGLFIAGADQLLAKASWNYGEIPDLNAVTDITSRSEFKHSGIQIIWDADTGKVRSGNVAGFNIYRQGIRLNNTPILAAATNNGLPEFTWYDRSAESAVATQYCISAESVFGIEGSIRPYTYDPAGHPREYKKAAVKEIGPLGYYFKDGINIKWSFPKDHERFLKGFYVEKNNLPNGYKRVSRLLNLSVHEFIDKSASPVDRYISYRIMAVYNDRTTVPGIERIYNYFPVREPPRPQNTTAKIVWEDKKVAVYLAWDHSMPGDTITDYYKVYAAGASNNKLVPVTDVPVNTNSYTFVIEHGSAAVYKFCISAISKNKTESTFSDTVVVIAPSLELPQPALPTVSPDSNRAVIRWQYPEIADLKGFRLFQNNTVIATETELKKNTREFIMQQPLAQGANYEFKIRAVAENNVLSDYSVPVHITWQLPR